MNVYQIDAPDEAAARRIATVIYREIRTEHDWGRRFSAEPSAQVQDRLANLSPGPVMVESAPRPPPRRARSAREPQRRVLVSGYPAALTRFERGWLAARRFTVLTLWHDEVAALRCPADRLFGYGRIAGRADGGSVHTPELEGMSGAGMWVLEPCRAGQTARLRLDAVQSACVHGRYMRGHDVGAALELFRH